MTSKYKTVQNYAKRRAVQRYDVLFIDEDLRNIVTIIQTDYKKAIFLERQSAIITIFKVIYKNQEYKVAYHKKLKQIVSFLPLTDEYISDPLSILLNNI